jgi:flagellar motor switch protein FliN/FliY
MTNEMLSQEEIDALLKGNIDEISNNMSADSQELDDTEKDTLGEIGNISMGTAATTLFTLLGQKVVITTPKVEISSIGELSKNYQIPFVAVDVKYKEGLTGANLLILKTDDVKAITDLMMGGDGTNIDRELNDMDLSAISEAMNQMVGSACTSLSEMFTEKIDIEPPRAFKINFVEDNLDLDIFSYTDPIVKVSFKMIVGNIIDSEIMQLIPLDFAKKMVNKLLNVSNEQTTQTSDSNINKGKVSIETNNVDDIQLDVGANEAALTRDMYRPEFNETKQTNQTPVNVRKVQFQSFDDNKATQYNESIELIGEVPIEISVELGRTSKKISEILEYGPGSIIELDKLVGEPLDILANGKYIAKGEVVVIDDNFGIRITEIINPSKRVGRL